MCIRPPCRGVSNRSPDDDPPTGGKQTTLPATPRMSYSSDVDASRPPPPLSTLRSVTSVPLRSPVSSDCWQSSDVRHATRAAEGGATPLTAVSPHEDAPEHLSDRNANDGKQSRDQGHAKAELRPPNRSPRIRLCGSPPLGSCVLAPPSAAPPDQAHPKQTREEHPPHRNRSQPKRVKERPDRRPYLYRENRHHHLNEP